MELPARMREEIGDDLGQPEEAKDCYCINILGHDPWAEHYECKRDDEYVNYYVRLAHLSLLCGGRPIAYRVEGYRDAK